MHEKVRRKQTERLIEVPGKINQSVYTDETVNTLNQAKEEAEKRFRESQIRKR